MGLLHINLRNALLAENDRVQRSFVSLRRKRAFRNQELEKLKLTTDELNQLGRRGDTDLKAAFRILGINHPAREEVAEDRLPAGRIVHLEAIRRICTNYGLIFRPFRDYKGQLTKEVAHEVIKLAGILGKEPGPSRFFIAAPKEMFCDCLVANDPFLFYEIGPDEYYLVHQWGLDASPLRLISHWPRGTRMRLFVTRTILCLLLVASLFAAIPQMNLSDLWAILGASVAVISWLRFFWEFKHNRGVHERHWFRA